MGENRFSVQSSAINFTFIFTPEHPQLLKKKRWESLARHLTEADYHLSYREWKASRVFSGATCSRLDRCLLASDDRHRRLVRVSEQSVSMRLVHRFIPRHNTCGAIFVRNHTPGAGKHRTRRRRSGAEQSMGGSNRA